MTSSTPRTTRLRRSALYVPGSNTKALSKAASLDCDVLLLDLEDSVPPSAKDQARKNVSAYLNQRPDSHQELVVRINDFKTPWADADISAIATTCPDGVLLPKAESTDQISQLASCLQLDERSGSRLEMWIMLETPRGVLSAGDLAAHPHVSALVLGTNDLAGGLHAHLEPTRAALLMSLQWCVLAARAHHRAIFDGVPVLLHDQATLREECEQARRLGFDGKTLVHPNQIATCNATFSPSPEDLAMAKIIVEAHARARNAGKEIAVVENRVVEALHAEQARRVLAAAEEIARRQNDPPSRDSAPTST